MKFLIIGSNGFIGSSIMAYLKQQGYDVTGTQKQSQTLGVPQFNLFYDRIRDCVGKDFFSEPVHVVIAAAETNMDFCELRPLIARRINIEKTIDLIKDVTDAGSKVTFLSSCYVFDGLTGYYNEESPRNPANRYGEHKAEVEDFLTANVFDAFIPRLEKIVGNGQMFATWYQRLKAGEKIECLEGSLISPTYVEDIAKAIEEADVFQCLRGVYHVCNPEFFYRDELARHFCRALGFDRSLVTTKPLKEFTLRAPRALKSYLDGSRFTGRTGLRFTPMSRVFKLFKEKNVDNVK